MHYEFDQIMDRISDPFSFSAKWQGPDYILKSLGISQMRDDMICLETADMDFKTAPEIIEDLKKLADHGIFGYSRIPDSYYQAVSDWFACRQDWQFPKEDIKYFPGTHDAIAKFVRYYTKPQDGVIILTPCYNYYSDVVNNQRRYITVDMINKDETYYVDYAALETACKDPSNTMIIMCHPHNPTGKVFTAEELKRIALICRENDVLIISDEVHSDILRKGQEFLPMMKVCGPQGLISCTAVNKTFNLAGLAMTNAIISDPKLKTAGDGFYCEPSPFGIQAVISAYTKGAAWVDALNSYLDENIDVCLDFINRKLPKAKVSRPEGGYSLYIDFSAYGLSDEEVISRIYSKAGVVLNSGLFFNDQRGKQVHRACLSSPRSTCLEAFSRIAEQFPQ